NNGHSINCTIQGFPAGVARGIDDQRTGGGRLFVVNTVVRDNGTGIEVRPSAGATAIRGFIDRRTITGNTSSGVLAGAGSRVSVSNSLVSGNSVNGLFSNATGGLAGPEINAESCIVIANGTGINNDAGSFFNMSNLFITTNATGLGEEGPTGRSATTTSPRTRPATPCPARRRSSEGSSRHSDRPDTAGGASSARNAAICRRSSS